MTYTIDQNNPLYAFIAPIMDTLSAKDNSIHELQIKLEDLTNQLSQSQSNLSDITKKLNDANNTITTLLNLPKPLEQWEIIADQILAAARVLDKFDVPYVFGGNNFSDGGFDCSGFDKLLFDVIAKTNLPRVSKDQAKSGTIIPKKDARKGDLLFFDYSAGHTGITHVGIYMGDGNMIHTNTPATKINIKAVNWDTVVSVSRYL